MTTNSTAYRLEFREDNNEPWRTFKVLSNEHLESYQEIIEGIKRLRPRFKVRVVSMAEGRAPAELFRVA